MLQLFALEEPTSVREASALLAHYGEAARLYAGGTELLLAMKEGLLHYDRLINIKTIAGLAGVTRDDDALRIGAATTHRDGTLVDRSSTARPPRLCWHRSWPRRSACDSRRCRSPRLIRP